MHSIKIRTKLLISHGAIVTVFILASLTVSLFLKMLSTDKNWTIHTYEVLEEADSMLLSLVNMETGIRGYLITGKDGFLAPYRNGKISFDKHIERISTLTSDNENQQQRLVDLRQQYNDWMGNYVDEQIALRNAVNSGTESELVIAKSESKETGKRAMDEMRAIIAVISSDEEKLLSQRYGSMNRSLSLSQDSMLYGVILSAVLGVIVATFISRSITRELGAEPYQVKAVTDTIANGDLTSTIPTSGNDDKSVICSIKKMRDQLRMLVIDVQKNSELLQQRSCHLTDAAKGINQALEEQNESTSSMAASLEELSVSITSVSDSAGEALKSSNELNEASIVGDKITQNTQREMDTIASLVGETADAVSRMSESSDRISNIIEVIREVTEQTNLLALNAAIEAARAGEMGRGFSVVADEVRKLAEKTSESANDIAQMIHVVKNHTDVAVSSMKAVVTSVQSGRELSQEANTKISSMQSLTYVVTDAINQIAVALKEQSQASITISQSVENIAQITEETAASAKSTDETAIELNGLANQLTDKTSRFITN